MRRGLCLSLALVALTAAGCSNGSTDDPSKFPPITEEQAAEIRQHDTSVEQEEKGDVFLPPGAQKGKK